MSGEPMRVRDGGLGPPFSSPRLSTFAELLFTRLVRTVHAVPLKKRSAVPLFTSRWGQSSVRRFARFFKLLINWS